MPLLSKLIFIVSLIVLPLYGQITEDYYEPPLRIPLFLSGNFAELRSNHFHSGLDFKTQQVVGKTVHAVADGYVSRLGVSPWGYGNVVYVNHFNGTTSVYAHLSRFAPRLDSLKKSTQYEKESYSIDQTYGPKDCPVEKGEIIAYSGNSGSSGGPHLHFELRDTETERVFNAIPYFKNRLKDTRPPQCRNILIDPVKGKGVVDGTSGKRILTVQKNKQGKTIVNTVPEVWGNIGIGIKAYDYMDETTNIYGVYSITLYVDDEPVAQNVVNGYDFGDTRYLNSYTDYEEWIYHRSWYIRSFREPGNKLDAYPLLKNDGIITINEERIYDLKYELKDAFDNVQTVSFQLKGVHSEISALKENGYKLLCRRENYFEEEGVRMNFPRDVLYKDAYLHYVRLKDSTCYSDVHSFRNQDVPLHSFCSLSIAIQEPYYSDFSKYYVADVTDGGRSFVGGTTNAGWITTRVRSFGDYAVLLDTVSPRITPKILQKAVENSCFKFQIADWETGIQSYRGTIDGKWVMFELSPSFLITYKFRRSDMAKGKEHLLVLEVIDNCGNIARLEHQFIW